VEDAHEADEEVVSPAAAAACLRPVSDSDTKRMSDSRWIYNFGVSILYMLSGIAVIILQNNTLMRTHIVCKLCSYYKVVKFAKSCKTLHTTIMGNQRRRNYAFLC
jgi:hypothetical protein